MTRFEYKTVNVPMKQKNRFSMFRIDREKLDETIKGLGEQGWELVSTFNHSISGSAMEIIMVFKRAVG
ncbi:MAG: DUF4177 domain-containing protein [Saprospiraceae bacterium]